MVFSLGSMFRVHVQVIVTLRFILTVFLASRFYSLPLITHNLPLIYIPVIYLHVIFEVRLSFQLTEFRKRKCKEAGHIYVIQSSVLLSTQTECDGPTRNFSRSSQRKI
jgi:hypothetical protein